MTATEPAETGNVISGGIQAGPVLQGRDIQATFHLPVAAPTALAQLPRAIAGFTGRDADLAVLARLLDPAGSAGPVVVSAVAGLAGVGKTTLAVAAGHAALRQGWFGGGVLFIDLHGYDETPVEPGQALGALLRALGVPAEHIPPTAEERAGLYRSVLAQISGPVLVLADNASAEAQVRPLLPGDGRHKVLVTSRHTLAGLNACLVDVTVLDDAASADLLDGVLHAARPGDDRITSDPAATARLTRICGGLPLALQIIAALLNADQTLSAAELAAELAAESGRLDRLVYDDGSGPRAPSVAAAFGLSCSRLDERSARVFRLLPANPGPDISTAAAAALAGLPVSETRRVLGGLGRAHLVETAPGRGGRWRMHDLLRLYARRLGHDQADADRREQAVDRLADYYLVTAAAAGEHLAARPGTAAPEAFCGPDDALAWLDAERGSLIAAVSLAAATGRQQVALHLPLQLSGYLMWRRQWDDSIAVTTISMDAARRLGDRTAEGIALNNLGTALRPAGRSEEAITACRDAAAVFREAGDWHGESTALSNLGLALLHAGRSEEAITACQDAAAISRRLGDRRREAAALTNLGEALWQLRRSEETITAQRDAAAIYREAGDRHGESVVLDNLGANLQQLRRFEEAITALQDAAVIYREVGDLHGEATALNNLAWALQQTGRSEKAIAALQDATAIYRKVGDRHGESVVLDNLRAVRPAPPGEQP